MPAWPLLAGGPTNRRFIRRVCLGRSKEGGCTGSCCSRDAVEAIALQIRFRARHRIDGLSLALADAPGSIDGPSGPDASGLMQVAFTYIPAWNGVVSVDVIGGFGQATDWTAPRLVRWYEVS